jgi:hypothetical protein
LSDGKRLGEWPFHLSPFPFHPFLPSWNIMNKLVE